MLRPSRSSRPCRWLLLNIDIRVRTHSVPPTHTWSVCAASLTHEIVSKWWGVSATVMKTPNVLPAPNTPHTPPLGVRPIPTPARRERAQLLTVIKLQHKQLMRASETSAAPPPSSPSCLDSASPLKRSSGTAETAATTAPTEPSSPSSGLRGGDGLGGGDGVTPPPLPPRSLSLPNEPPPPPPKPAAGRASSAAPTPTLEEGAAEGDEEDVVPGPGLTTTELGGSSGNSSSGGGGHGNGNGRARGKQHEIDQAITFSTSERTHLLCKVELQREEAVRARAGRKGGGRSRGDGGRSRGKSRRREGAGATGAGAGAGGATSQAGATAGSCSSATSGGTGSCGGGGGGGGRSSSSSCGSGSRPESGKGERADVVAVSLGDGYLSPSASWRGCLEGRLEVREGVGYGRFISLALCLVPLTSEPRLFSFPADWFGNPR